MTRLEHGDCPRIPQDEAAVTLSPSLPPDIGALDWQRPARDLHNLVRGVTPRPGAYGFWQGKRLKVWKTEVVGTSHSGRTRHGSRSRCTGYNCEYRQGSVATAGSAAGKQGPHGRRRLGARRARRPPADASIPTPHSEREE